MTLADELDLKGLRGAAYAEVMQKAVVVKEFPLFNLGVSSGPATSSSPLSSSTPPVTADEDAGREREPEPPLTSAQRLRLLTGYYRLTRTWDHLRLHPPAFVHATSCGATWHQHGCMQSWTEFWKEKTRR
jgi:hypothetical protein